MANTIYTKVLEGLSNGTIDFDAAGTVVRAMLERSTSTYAVNKDHSFVSDLSGFVEISVASYTRKTVANKSVTKNDTNDRVQLGFDNVSFGNLESGQTAKAVVFYVQTGGSDATPADDILIGYFDTATGLPAVLGGGEVLVTIDVTGLIRISQP